MNIYISIYIYIYIYIYIIFFVFTLSSYVALRRHEKAGCTATVLYKSCLTLAWLNQPPSQGLSQKDPGYEDPATLSPAQARVVDQKTEQEISSISSIDR